MADPQMICLFFLAVILLFFGYPEQALRKSKEALALARQCSHPYGLAFALSGAAWFHINRREGLAAQAYAEELMTLAQKHGFAASLAIGTALQGGSLAEQGQWERGSALIRQGLAAWQATGAGLGVLPWLITLAALPRESQGVQDGLTMLAEAEAAMQWSGERLFEAELYRVKGELLLQKFPVSSSEFRVVDPQPPSPG
jgi:predicted ATPase